MRNCLARVLARPMGFVLGAWVWYRGGHIGFLVGALCMLANWPWTLLVIRPVNSQLMAIEPNAAGPASRALIERWNELHLVRTVLGSLAVAAFLIGLLAD